MMVILSDVHGCSDETFPLSDVLHTGIVLGYRYDDRRPHWCPQLKAQATAKPGEVVIFDKRLTTWDRMRQEIP